MEKRIIKVKNILQMVNYFSRVSILKGKCGTEMGMIQMVKLSMKLKKEKEI